MDWEVALDTVLFPPAEGWIGKDDVDAVGLGVADVRPGEGIVVPHETRVLDAVEQHVCHTKHVRELLLLDCSQRRLHTRLIFGPLHVAITHVVNGAGEKAASAAGGVERYLPR